MRLRFWTRPEPEPEPEAPPLTGTAYMHWLLAGRPPFEWFMAQGADLQETLATIGDDHTKGVLIDMGYAIQDPKLVQTALAVADDPDDKDAQGALLQRVLAEAAGRMLNGSGASTPQPAAPEPVYQPPSLDGMAERNTAARDRLAKHGAEMERRGRESLTLPGGAT